MNEQKITRMWKTTGLVSSLIFGVILPILTIGIELYSGLCAGLLFDPVPTPVHAMLIAFVPLANLLLILALLPGGTLRPRLHGWLNAAALGISGYYALMFAPFTPFAVVAVFYFGFGLIPLAPLASFIIAIRLRIRALYFASENETF